MAELTPDMDPSPWTPELNPRNLKALGKAGEELNECGKAVARCIIQGIEECDPETGKKNRLSLEDEIADVEATCEILKRQFGLDRERITARAARKFDYLWRWLPMATVVPSRMLAALRRLQEGAALAISLHGLSDGPVADFLAAIHRECVKGMLASDEVINQAGEPSA